MKGSNSFFACFKELPEPVSIRTKIQGELFGDAIMVVEFLNIFGTFYDIKDTLQQDITYGMLFCIFLII